MFAALAVGTFGLYRPRLRDLPLTALTVFAVALVIFGVNLLLRRTGLHPKANYFYSVENGGEPAAGAVLPLDPAAVPLSAAQHRDPHGLRRTGHVLLRPRRAARREPRRCRKQGRIKTRAVLCVLR
jgi:hypothetical protein